MKPTFSILIPTRNRMAALQRLLDSIAAKTNRLDKVEVIVAADFDDMDSATQVSRYAQLSDLGPSLKLFMRGQSDNLSDDYYNAMARLSTGSIIWVLNDDCEIVTDGWDKIIVEAAAGYVRYAENSVYYIDTYDTTRNFNNNGHFSCFPMLSRQLYEALGHFFHPSIRTWGADKYLHYVCEQADCILQCLDVHVEHYREAKDHNFEHMQRVFREDNLSTIRTRIDLDYYATKIKAAKLSEDIRSGKFEREHV